MSPALTSNGPFRSARIFLVVAVSVFVGGNGYRFIIAMITKQVATGRLSTTGDDFCQNNGHEGGLR